MDSGRERVRVGWKVGYPEHDAVGGHLHECAKDEGPAHANPRSEMHISKCGHQPASKVGQISVTTPINTYVHQNLYIWPDRRQPGKQQLLLYQSVFNPETLVPNSSKRGQ